MKVQYVTRWEHNRGKLDSLREFSLDFSSTNKLSLNMQNDTEKGTGLKYWKGKSIWPEDWKKGNTTAVKKGENEQGQFV